MKTAISKNGNIIRLTDERWQHISTGHPEMAGFYFEILETIEDPEFIYKGNRDELIAKSGRQDITDKFIIVVYKEFEKQDGFVITAFLSNKLDFLEKKKIIWKR